MGAFSSCFAPESQGQAASTQQDQTEKQISQGDQAQTQVQQEDDDLSPLLEKIQPHPMDVEGPDFEPEQEDQEQQEEPNEQDMQPRSRGFNLAKHAAQQEPEGAERVEGFCAHVSDGDTILVKVAGQNEKLRVRFRAVDAPESKQTFGPESKAFLANLVDKKDVVLYIYERDHYGRVVADVHVGGIFVQEKQLEEGMVWFNSKFDKRARLGQLEKKARAARKGLWKEARPTPPWVYRRENGTPYQTNA
eukprot:TRINITY_DN4565_c0_g1_i1.p1 TRINITY_DN4565_c0_g1~~TRINITY_DN4565_c0_g1_i1.p1  ORF type:complete len:248 (-),score=74.57 TRINITY_DN4565_c0_g1_i1:169-912(-)